MFLYPIKPLCQLTLGDGKSGITMLVKKEEVIKAPPKNLTWNEICAGKRLFEHLYLSVHLVHARSIPTWKCQRVNDKFGYIITYFLPGRKYFMFRQSNHQQDISSVLSFIGVVVLLQKVFVRCANQISAKSVQQIK